jgi:hypothetical protein
VTKTPRKVLQFPDLIRKADCQGESRVPHPISLSERLKRIKAGLENGMTLADVQHEYDAEQSEIVMERWAKQLANNPRRSPAAAAAFLCALAGRLNGEVEA